MRKFYFWLALLPVFLFVNSCGSGSSASSGPYKLFQSAQGGIIYYLDSSKEHGLAVAKADIATQLQWDTAGGGGGYVGAVLTELFDGFQNTELIFKAIGSNGQAASSCHGYSSQFSGWYLPSLQELNEIYFLQTEIGTVFSNSAAYWSSSESTSNSAQAWAQIFSSGGQQQATKTSLANIRCTRAF